MAKRLIFLLLYFAILAVVYSIEISVYWKYMGFDYNFNIYRILSATIIIFVFSIFLSSNLNTRNIFLTLIIYLHLIPSLTLFAFSNQDIKYISLVVAGTLLVFIFAHIKFLRPVIFSVSWRLAAFFSISISLIVLLVIISYVGFSNINFNLVDVYEYRRDSQEKLPGIISYLRPSVTKVFIPFALSVALFSRNKFMITSLSIIIIMYFALTHHKIILFGSLLVIVVYFYIKNYKNTNAISYIWITAVTICLIEILLNKYVFDYNHYSQITSIIARRSLLLPPLLDSYYVEFFSTAELYYWSQSKLTLGFSTMPHEITAPYLIGEFFFGSASMSANTGFIGAGYSNAGFIGILLYGAIIGLVIALLQSHGERVGHVIVICASVILILGAVRGSDLPTVLLTHGLLFLLVLFSCLPSRPPSIRSRSQRLNLRTAA